MNRTFIMNGRKHLQFLWQQVSCVIVSFFLTHSLTNFMNSFFASSSVKSSYLCFVEMDLWEIPIVDYFLKDSGTLPTALNFKILILILISSSSSLSWLSILDRRRFSLPSSLLLKNFLKSSNWSIASSNFWFSFLSYVNLVSSSA